ncbi:MAG TPA: TPR end-of-group domain-containing protein [Candidatus Tripitaka sp. YC43]
MGKKEDFLYCLKRAVTLEPKYGEEAKKNPCFQDYREERKFKEIVGEQSLN